jgi:hypothetical protein
MKKHLLLFVSASLLLCFTSSSQVFSKKDRLFGASAGISYYNSTDVPSALNDRRSSNVGLIPSFAWAVKDNLAAGIKVGVTYSRTVNENGLQKNTQTALVLGPSLFIRKYKALVNSFGVSFTHELNGYYYKTKNKNGTDISKSSSWGTGYSFIPAAFYKFSNRFIGEADFGGVFLNYSKGANTKNWTAVANFLTYVNIGIQYIIRKNRS